MAHVAPDLSDEMSHAGKALISGLDELDCVVEIQVDVAAQQWPADLGAAVKHSRRRRVELHKFVDQLSHFEQFTKAIRGIVDLVGGWLQHLPEHADVLGLTSQVRPVELIETGHGKPHDRLAANGFT